MNSSNYKAAFKNITPDDRLIDSIFNNNKMMKKHPHKTFRLLLSVFAVLFIFSISAIAIKTTITDRLAIVVKGYDEDRIVIEDMTHEINASQTVGKYIITLNKLLSDGYRMIVDLSVETNDGSALIPFYYGGKFVELAFDCEFVGYNTSLVIYGIPEDEKTSNKQNFLFEFGSSIPFTGDLRLRISNLHASIDIIDFPILPSADLAFDISVDTWFKAAKTVAYLSSKDANALEFIVTPIGIVVNFNSRENRDSFLQNINANTGGFPDIYAELADGSKPLIYPRASNNESYKCFFRGDVVDPELVNAIYINGVKYDMIKKQ